MDPYNSPLVVAKLPCLQFLVWLDDDFPGQEKRKRPLLVRVIIVFFSFCIPHMDMCASWCFSTSNKSSIRNPNQECLSKGQFLPAPRIGGGSTSSMRLQLLEDPKCRRNDKGCTLVDVLLSYGEVNQQKAIVQELVKASVLFRGRE